MKQFIACILSISLIFVLFGCSKEEKTYDSNEILNNSNVSSIKDETTTENVIIEPEVPNENEENIYVEKPIIIPEDLEYTGKEIKTYGDVNQTLISELTSVLSKYNKNISIACWKTDGSMAVTYNTNQTYFSACTIKIPIMLYCCKLIDAGKISKDTQLTYQEKHYHGGSGKIRYQAYGTKYTVEYLINQGLSISDNVAYEMIVDYIGHEGFNAMLEELGCKSLIVPNYSIWASKAQVNDFVKVWEAVYNYFNKNTVGSNILKTACTNTPFNYGSRAIKEYEYSHKSGDNFGASCAYNDAGIIWSNTPYVYAIFTKSEGEYIDANTVDNAMKIINEIMTKENNTSLQ